MASPCRKESFNCTSPGWQDKNQEQKKSAQKILFGNMLSSFRLKQTKTMKGDGNAVLCKKDKAGSSGFLPWMDKVLKSVSRSLFGSCKQRTSAKFSEADKFVFEKDPIDRKACSKDKPKDAWLMENHLKPLLNSLQGNVPMHHFSRCPAKPKCVKYEDFPVGVLLFQPVENSNLAEGTLVGMKKAGLQKQSALGFARLHGEPAIICSESSGGKEELPRSIDMMSSGESLRGSPLRLHGMQLTSFLDLIPGQAAPDKEKLNTVQDFFSYAEVEGKRVFEELDKDKDGKVSVDDISAAMQKMKLPSSYAKKFMHSKHKPWLANSLGWIEFASLMQEKEPTILRLFNSLGVSKHGTVNRAHIKHLLMQHSFSASDSTITAMMEAVGGEKDFIKYGQFRKFMLLVPTEQLRSDPWSVWFTAATTGSKSEVVKGRSESEVVKGSVFKHVTVLSRNFVCHLDAAKGKVATPNLPKVEDMSEFLRATVKHVIHEPFTKVVADVPKIGG